MEVSLWNVRSSLKRSSPKTGEGDLNGPRGRRKGLSPKTFCSFHDIKGYSFLGLLKKHALAKAQGPPAAFSLLGSLTMMAPFRTPLPCIPRPPRLLWLCLWKGVSCHAWGVGVRQRGFLTIPNSF